MVVFKSALLPEHSLIFKQKWSNKYKQNQDFLQNKESVLI